MRIGLDMAARIVELLCEGASPRSTSRLTNAAPNTILDLLLYLGERCEAYAAENIRNVFVGDVQVDEIWQYVFCKKATAKRRQYVGGCGDSYCFTAIDRTTKLLVTWHMGQRTEADCRHFIHKLDAATSGHFHVSTDAWRSYPSTIRRMLGHRVDHGVMTKIYGRPIEYPQRQYSPPRIIAAAKTPMHGDVYQHDRICTSHVERMNGTIRTWCKRMARLTYCFSKRWNNHRAALALLFLHYNFCRKHRTLKGLTPAMAHGLTTEVWSVRRLIESVCQG
jgi:IS1 family transposase